MKRLFLGFLTCLILGNAPLASALVGKQDAGSVSAILVPHRAVYELTLANKNDAVSVSSVEGRMVFEITGAACARYIQKMRMITRVTDTSSKKSLFDIRSNTTEEGSGKHFSFSSSQYLDKNLQEVIKGAAKRNGKNSSISIHIKKPDATRLDIPSDVLFPMQHSMALIKAAMAGKKRLDARIYDGSEQGQGFYQTYAYIGKKLPARKAANGQSGKDHRKLVRLGLAALPSWPVAISYFDARGHSDDTLPAYEMSFRLFANGVSHDLLINYGKFKVRGALEQIKYLRAGACGGGKKAR